MPPSGPAGGATNSSRTATNDATKAKPPMIQLIVKYQGSEELENSRLQRLWNEEMESAYTSPSGYQRISAILISWHEELDDLNTKDEVNELESVFRDIYNYRTTSKRIDKQRKAQVQMNKFLSEWVYDEDGDNTLLIVYYAGHGVPGQDPGQLKLAGKRCPDQDPTELNEVAWNHAESNLGDAKADVLVVFDCCHAGDLGRTWRPELHQRSFEFIGATSAGALTKIPGKSSFTTALIWALKKLAKKHETFTTSELVRETSRAPDFPKSQVPILAERNATSYVRIQLSIISKDNEAESPQISKNINSDDDLDPQYLELRFAFDNKPTDKEITHIAGALRELIKYNRLSARRIDWGGLRSSDIVKIAASKFLQNGVRQRVKRASQNALRSPVSPDIINDASTGLLSPSAILTRVSGDRAKREAGLRSRDPESDGHIRSRVRKQDADLSVDTKTRKKRRVRGSSSDESGGSGYVVIEK